MHNFDAVLSDAWSGKSVSSILWEFKLFPRADLAKYRLVVVYLTGMAFKTGVLETQLPDIVET